MPLPSGIMGIVDESCLLASSVAHADVDIKMAIAVVLNNLNVDICVLS